MSVVPLMFRDWWDDFDRPVSRLMDQHFGRALNRDDLLSRFSDLGLERPLRSIFRDRYYRPWRTVARQASSGSSTIQIDSKDNFQDPTHAWNPTEEESLKGKGKKRRLKCLGVLIRVNSLGLIEAEKTGAKKKRQRV
ncbi:hypothetical protein K0M31_017716 [Melipona bicolor]|uniref:Uncharacterized protein n=1 Tax=Melipona bicolor TaxID=60889 RepID=A0AA40G5K7_9HYME|nr:hypothetical protein K0M31_017716 [Melipona bicolor]